MKNAINWYHSKVVYLLENESPFTIAFTLLLGGVLGAMFSTSIFELLLFGVINVMGYPVFSYYWDIWVTPKLFNTEKS